MISSAVQTRSETAEELLVGGGDLIRVGRMAFSLDFGVGEANVDPWRGGGLGIGRGEIT